VSTVTEQPYEGNHPNAYDFRDNPNPAGTILPSRGETEVPQEQDGPSVVVETPPAAAAAATAAATPLLQTSAEIRAAIKAAKPYSSTEVDVPEWGIRVQIRSMTLGARNAMTERTMERNDENERAGLPKGTGNLKAMYSEVLAGSVYGLDGIQVFTADDAEWIQSLDAPIIDKLAKPALILNGLQEPDKAVEAEAKKSSSTGTSD
jgi:hypothetical protein